jgi:hypothetical protein
MDLIDRLKQIGDRVEKMKAQVGTEEATKNAFIMPFIQALGYDVFNPMEVIPEFTAEIGTKKGEKVDYCICIDEKPTIIIECKSWQQQLDVHQSQLFRYFHVVEARFAILTNGISYRFYADLEEKNKMDEKPFFEFSITKITENNINALKRFQKSNFDIDTILDNASDLKYSKEIKDILAQELNHPSDEFVKLIARQVYSGKVTSRVLEQFKILTQKSSSLLIKEIINDRLSKVIDNNIEEDSASSYEDEQDSEATEEEDNGIETTEEELQGYRVIQAILLPIIASDRVFYRDTKSYFSILLDNNNRKCICRLWLNRSKKYLEVFDVEKKSEKILIEKIEDIYTHKERIIASASKFIDEQAV